MDCNEPLATSCGLSDQASGGAQLRKVLNVMFPATYIEIYHKPPNSVCSLLKTRCYPQSETQERELCDHHQDGIEFNESCLSEEASTEPSSRANLLSFREHFNDSLVEHQAKAVGLCPVRRAIYDQCFDELIRQVTVGCVERGLLLFRIRNELRMTINSYRRAYESGVEFGLKKAIGAELELERSRAQIRQLEMAQENINKDSHLKDRINEIELKNKLDSVDKMRDYFKRELAKKDQVIEQQRAIIKALSQDSIADLRGPIF